MAENGHKQCVHIPFSDCSSGRHNPCAENRSPWTGIGGDKVSTEARLLRGIEAGYHMNSTESVRYLILYCSATRSDCDYPPAQMLCDHKTRGFRTIGYHFYVRKDGSYTQHREVMEVGAHCRPYNRCSIGLCYEGGLDHNGKPANTLTQAQVERLTELFKELLTLFPQATIMGHRDMPGSIPKDCPCLNTRQVFGYLDKYR